jgi:hypothetical protein
MFALGVYRVARDCDSGQLGHGVEQRLEACDLVGLLADVQLGGNQSGGVLLRGEQRDFPARPFALAAPADSCRPRPVRGAVRSRSLSVGGPRARRPIVRSGASPSMRASGRRTVVSEGRTRHGRSGLRRAPTCLGTCAGASAIHSPTASSEVAPASTAHAVSASTTGNCTATGRIGSPEGPVAVRADALFVEAVAHPAWITRVRYFSQPLQQTRDSLDTTARCSRSWSRVGGISDDASAGTVFHSVHGASRSP